MILQLTHHKIFYDDLGTGDPVLLIHGFPLSHKIWEPQINFLVKQNFRVIAPDLRGFGNSTSPGEVWEINDFADDVIALLDHLNVKKCSVIGMSMGGYIIFNLFKRYQHRFSNAVFIATKASADDPATKERRNALISSARKIGIQTVTDAFKSILFNQDTYSENQELVDKVERIMLSTSFNGIVGGMSAIRDRNDYVEDLQNFYVPSLVIHGDSDKAVHFENADVTASGLPDAELEIIKNAGHMVNLEAPEKINESILRFLK
ncbi:MAG: alpha/beta hydrolase [Ignavibacteria bacterium]|nr:alpha/beta hydrolase [Ignavibacteria bacterium]